MTTSAPATLTDRLRDRYRVERLLGRGGMGAVYLARDLRLDRLVAIKELPAELAGDPILRERFLREVRMAAGFSHPNIVPVYAIEEHEGTLAFVMGFVEGESLAERVRRAGPIGVRDAVRLLQDIAYALAYAHGRGVVHRDLKPDNIMIERATGRALLMDFGVARPTSAAPTAQDGMTRVGEVVGTPEYMSPEQATGDNVDGRSDLYSLGLTAYFALTGEVAFGGDSVQRILVRQLTEAPPSLATKRPDLPDALCTIVEQSLAKDREERFASAEALIESLEASQVAAPDVALPIRIFASELETLGLIGMFMLLAAIVIASSMAENTSVLDGSVPVVLLAAVFLGRLLQTRAEARRLHEDGFEPHLIRAGVQVVIAEREARRAQLRTNPVIVARRRRTILMGAFQLLIAPLLVWGAFRLRIPNPGGGYSNGLPGVSMLFSGLVCGGIGLVLLLRSPFRGGVPERLLKRLAFGLPSRWLIGRDSGSLLPGTTIPPTRNSGVRSPTPRATTPITRAPITPPTMPATHAGSAADVATLPAGDAVATQTLAAIDARLARIEAALEASAQRNSQPLR